MHPVLFRIGAFTANSYGFLIAVGFLCALVMAIYRAKKAGLSEDIIYSLGLLCLPGGMIGAKLLFIITEFQSIYANPSILLDISNGFVVFGGIIGGALTGYIYCKVKKISFLEYFDLAVPSVALAQGFGRIGCFLAGCCYGRETDSFLRVVFNQSSYAPNGISLMPTQLFSSAGDFLIALTLILYSRRKREKGKIVLLYLTLYSVGRFFVEFLRNDPRGSVGILSTSQFVSACTLVVVFVLYGFMKYRIKRLKTNMVQ
ncbi:MAG TPA: prolipoprotein diacylglyceryl transferase [Clostridia bacterium]|nr:prolipoprotein diacylglyceryl transferase [Clostridia bacterium]